MKEDEKRWREGGGGERYQSSSSFQEINNRENMIKPSSPLYPPPSSSYLPPPSSYPPPPSSYPPPPSSYPPPSSSLPRNVSSNLMGDFIDLLEPSNSREMLVFAMQNLAPAIEAITPGILNSDKSYLKFLNLIEIILPPELQQAQIELLDSVAENLRENRAEDGLKAKVYNPPSSFSLLSPSSSLLPTYLPFPFFPLFPLPFYLYRLLSSYHSPPLSSLLLLPFS